jgi:hypothetical protein
MFSSQYKIYNYNWVPTLINIVYFNYLFNLLALNIHNF